MRRRRRVAVVHVVGVLWLCGVFAAACSGGGRLDTVNAGRTLVYEPGVPNFDLEAVASLQNGQSGIDLYLGVPRSSLVFVQEGNAFAARFEVLVRVLDEEGKRVVTEVDRIDTTKTSVYEETRSYAPVLLQERLTVDPGTYLLSVTVTDVESGRQARRRQHVEVFEPGSARPVLTRIRFVGIRDDTAAPILSLNIPSDLDSLRGIVGLYNAGRLQEIDVVLHVLRFPVDGDAAAPPYAFTTLQPQSLVRYDRPDTLYTSRHTVREALTERELSFPFPALEEGIYRAEIAIVRPNAGPDAEAILLQRRDFAVRRPSFPRITTLDEMVDALAYITYDRELQHIQSAPTPGEKKRRFDAFWGSLVPDRQTAANLIKLYYSRVKEANLLYTTYKEGWKTDRGMVYILFGSPIYVDARVDREVWHYSYDERDLTSVFVFDRHRLYASDGTFESYLLRREVFYERAWVRAFNRWRRGEVL